MLTIQQWLTDSSGKLMKANIPSSRLDCLVILENTLKKPREWLLAHSDKDISVPIINILNKRLAQRLRHIPLAYITGRKEFYGRSFLVNSNVLIPRPESEDIIELLKNIISEESESPSIFTTHSPPPTIIDVGTGSGCLAITAKLELPGSTVKAIDISSTALSVAKQNAKLLKTDVEFKISDLLQSVEIRNNTVLLMNLPYVPKTLINSEEITKEPAAAIFSGDDGLDHYRRAWSQLGSKKSREIVVITESLLDQHDKMVTLAFSSGFKLHKVRDLAQLFVLK